MWDIQGRDKMQFIFINIHSANKTQNTETKSLGKLNREERNEHILFDIIKFNVYHTLSMWVSFTMC